MGRRWQVGVAPRLLILLFVLNVLAAAAFGAFVYNALKAEILYNTDRRLRTAAAAVSEVAAPDYQARISGPSSVPAGDYETMARSLSRLADAGGFTYVYTYMPFDGRFRTTASSGTAEEWRRGEVAAFFEAYDSAPEPMWRSVRDGRVRFSEYTDEYGRFRSIFVPARDAGGRAYIVGADVELSHLEAALRGSLEAAVLIGLAIFAASMVLGSLMIGRIVRPLTQLTAFMGRLADNGFQTVPADLATLQAIARRRDEVGALGDAVGAMNERLVRYLEELQAAMAERERAEGELAAAAEIQMGMTPRLAPPIAGRADLDVHATLRPAKAVGGDFYDVFLLEDGRLFLVIGDVSGKGVPASLFMARTITLFRGYASPRLAVGDIMGRVNAELCRDNAGAMFVTAFAAVADLATGRLDFSNAGHEAPFMRRARGVERLGRADGMAMGVMDDAAYTTSHAELGLADTLVAFTDGVTEALDPKSQLFGVERLGAVIAEAATTAGARDAVDDVVRRVDAFAAGEPQADDIAVIAIKRLS